MDIINENDSQESKDYWNQIEKTHRRGKILGGLVVLSAGVLFLLREMGFWLPEWLFTWQMLLITIGLFVGFKHSFRKMSWFVLVLIGSAFMVQEFVPGLEISRFLWPIIFIIIGLYMIVKPRRNHAEKWKQCQQRYQHKYRHHYQQAGANYGDTADHLETSAVFGSVKKNIISKDFKGGEINAVFGGAEINLSQADFQNSVKLEINAVFGGARLIIPPNWEIKSEMSAVLGSVEDKRPIMRDVVNPEPKILILSGSAVFGGIEINSF